MPDSKTMWTRCLGGFSFMWVTKLLISPVKKRIFCPKTTKFGPELAFLVNLGQAMQAYSVPCWRVGWWLWRAGCISQDTYLLYSHCCHCSHFSHCSHYSHCSLCSNCSNCKTLNSKLSQLVGEWVGRAPIWLDKSHFQQQVGWGTGLVSKWQLKSHFYPTTRILNSSLLFATTLSQNGRRAV